MTDEESSLRNELQTLMKRVPDGVNSGSYQKAVNFKKFYAQCQKVLRGRPTATALRSLIDSYRSY